MGIYTTMYNGLSGVGRFSDNMSVLANNISNLNTTAYKSSRSAFEEVVTNVEGRIAGGSGVRLNSIAENFTPGSFQSTNVPSDMAISGSGFFVVRDADSTTDLYTRDGQFSLKPNDASQDVLDLVSSMGYYVQGYDIDSATGATATTLSDISFNRINEPQATENVRAIFNLEFTDPAPADAPALFDSWDGQLLDADNLPDPISSDAYEFSSDLKIIDDQDNSHDLTIYFDNTANENEKAFLLTCDPTTDRRLIGAGPERYNDSGAVANKGAGALLYGLLQFSDHGDLTDVSCYQVPADGNVDPGSATNLLQLGRGESDYSFSYNFTGLDTSDLTSTINFGTTPVPQAVTSPEALLISAAGEPARAASSTSTWNEVYDLNGNKPAAGDVVTITGTDGAGNAVTLDYTINPASQVADLLANLQDQFDCTAIITDGKLQLIDNVAGDSQLAIDSISFQDASGGDPATNSSLAQIFGSEGDVFATREQERFQIDAFSTTSFANSSALLNYNSDGYGTGYLNSISVDKYGVISGDYSNGHQIAEAQLALSDFTNYSGLQKAGSNMYTASDEVGTITTGTAGSDGLGTIAGGSLESSNVDLGDQFTQLITTQRYYQANAKSISTADEIYDVLVRMVT